MANESTTVSNSNWPQTSGVIPVEVGEPSRGSDSHELHWVDKLRDGTAVSIRPITDEDVTLERRFIEGLSPQSSRFRFLGEVKTPSPELLRQFTHLDHASEVAFVALIADGTGDREIGVSRYSARTDGLSCECAVAVSDEWQQRGLATLLMGHLIDVARQKGIASMYSIDANDNFAMRDLAEHLGFQRKTDPDDASQVIHTLDLKAAVAGMKAFVYRGVNLKALEDHPKPKIQAPGDAIVKMLKTTICGTDLHILKGDVATCAPGRILGHEGVGIVDAVGAGVTAFKVGDHVLISCISSCGKCEYCRRSMYSHCTTGGWILGNEIDGTQAEYVRTPHADTSLYPIPRGTDEEALVMLSDILPTGFECGVLNGKVAPGSTVAIVGSGPIGLAALLTAQFYSPAEIIAIDVDDNRLAIAKAFGATQTINSSDGKAADAVKAMTGGRGVDTAIEAVGIAATFELCEKIIAPGGTLANIGVHGKKVDLHLEWLWSQNIAITTRLVDTVSTPMLMKTVLSKKLDPARLITHRFTLDKILDAYDTFERAAETKALKVIIEVAKEAGSKL